MIATDPVPDKKDFMTDANTIHSLHDILNRQIASGKLNSKTSKEQKKTNKPGTAKKRAKTRKANKLARNQRKK